MTVAELLAQIAKRDNSRAEATLQADIRQLILTVPLSLSEDDVRIADMEAHGETRGNPVSDHLIERMI